MTEKSNEKDEQLTNKSAAQKLIASLESCEAFKQWHKDHKKSTPSHFFLQINEKYAATSAWDIGYYDSESNKVTVFTLNDAGKFEIKTTDDVFATKTTKIYPLVVDEKTLDFPLIIPHAEKLIAEEFSEVKNLRGNGFAILQNIDGKVVWNISFITKKLTFLNIKLDATTGEKIAASNESAIVPEAK